MYWIVYDVEKSIRRLWRTSVAAALDRTCHDISVLQFHRRRSLRCRSTSTRNVKRTRRRARRYVCLSVCPFVYLFSVSVIVLLTVVSCSIGGQLWWVTLPFWQPADCWVQFDIDFVMKCWLIKCLSISIGWQQKIVCRHSVLSCWLDW